MEKKICIQAGCVRVHLFNLYGDQDESDKCRNDPNRLLLHQPFLQDEIGEQHCGSGVQRRENRRYVKSSHTRCQGKKRIASCVKDPREGNDEELIAGWYLPLPAHDHKCRQQNN